MIPITEIMMSVEQLEHRVTVGDVVTATGLKLNLVQQGLLTLASDSGGHLQVTESGEVIYLFPKNFKIILRNKYWKLRFKETSDSIWNIIFYLIRISFGIILIISIILTMIAITIIIISFSSKQNRDYQDSRGSYNRSNFIYFPNFLNLFWVFRPNLNHDINQDKLDTSRAINQQTSELNFLESVFSFIFGDGNPNHYLEECRWREIGAVIRNNKGAIIAQQIFHRQSHLRIYLIFQSP